MADSSHTPLTGSSQYSTVPPPNGYTNPKDRDQIEGGSHIRPPKFNGEYYASWKTQMLQFLLAQGIEIWRMVIVKKDIPDLEKHVDFTPEEVKLVEMNAKAMNCLYNALNSTELHRVLTCKTAYDLWEKLKPTWRDSDSSEFESEDDKAHSAICFMALEEDDAHSSLQEEVNDQEPLSYDELNDLLCDVHEKYDKTRAKFKALKKQFELAKVEHDSRLVELVEIKRDYASLKSKYDESRDDCDNMNELVETTKSEHDLLKENFDDLLKNSKVMQTEIETLNAKVSKFAKGKENLNSMIGGLRAPNDHRGLGYNEPPKPKRHSKSKFSNFGASTFHCHEHTHQYHSQSYYVDDVYSYDYYHVKRHKNVKCNYCGILGHISYFCNARHDPNLMWVAKTNSSGPKRTWVPKATSTPIVVGVHNLQA